MKKILAVLNQGQSLLNPVPSLDLIDITHLPNGNLDTIFDYLSTLYDYMDELQWMILPESNAVRFHGPEEGWIQCKVQAKK